MDRVKKVADLRRFCRKNEMVGLAAGEDHGGNPVSAER